MSYITIPEEKKEQQQVIAMLIKLYSCLNKGCMTAALQRKIEAEIDLILGCGTGEGNDHGGYSQTVRFYSNLIMMMANQNLIFFLARISESLEKNLEIAAVFEEVVRDHGSIKEGLAGLVGLLYGLERDEADSRCLPGSVETVEELRLDNPWESVVLLGPRRLDELPDRGGIYVVSNGERLFSSLSSEGHRHFVIRADGSFGPLRDEDFQECPSGRFRNKITSGYLETKGMLAVVEVYFYEDEGFLKNTKHLHAVVFR